MLRAVPAAPKRKMPSSSRAVTQLPWYVAGTYLLGLRADDPSWNRSSKRVSRDEYLVWEGACSGLFEGRELLLTPFNVLLYDAGIRTSY